MTRISLHYVYQSLCKPPVCFHAGGSMPCPARSASRDRDAQTGRCQPPSSVEGRSPEENPALRTARPPPFPSLAPPRCGAASDCRLTDVISPPTTGGGFKAFLTISFSSSQGTGSSRGASPVISGRHVAPQVLYASGDGTDGREVPHLITTTTI